MPGKRSLGTYLHRLYKYYNWHVQNLVRKYKELKEGDEETHKCADSVWKSFMAK